MGDVKCVIHKFILSFFRLKNWVVPFTLSDSMMWIVFHKYVLSLWMITHMSSYLNLQDEKVNRSSFSITQNPTFNDSTHLLLCIKAHHLWPTWHVHVQKQVISNPATTSKQTCIICNFHIFGLRRQVFGEESYENLRSVITWIMQQDTQKHKACDYHKALH